MSYRIKQLLAIVIGAALILSFNAVNSAPAAQEDIVAVASSIHECIKELASEFEAEKMGRALKIVAGASGKLASQIMAGAPFGLYLSASPEWAEKLQKEGFLFDVFPMASSPLVAWWAKDEPISTDALKKKDVRISIADTKAAPFGKAAANYLQSIGIYDKLLEEKRLVIMGNVEQAALAVKSGGADIGMFSLSIAKKLNEGRYVVLPVEPLQNSGGLVKERYSENLKAFWEYIRSENANETWIKWGFEPVQGK